MEGYLRGKVPGNLQGCSTKAVQSNTMLVHASAQKNSAGTEMGASVLVPGKILCHGTGVLHEGVVG